MLAIIVPYRDREDHLAQFIPHMNKYIPDAKIVIMEQVDDKPFNRGKLINCGFLESDWPEWLVAHDVDMLPVNVDYSFDHNFSVVQLAKSKIQKSDYLGGVTLFFRGRFQQLMGYHNDYFHRAEDNELMFRIKSLLIPVSNRFGTFHQLPHPRTGPEFIPELWQKAQLPRIKNMLATCEYEVVSKEVFDTHTHIKVNL
jgi:hypothetical protein